MIVYKLNRFLFEFDYANPPVKEKIDFEDLVKKLSKMTTEEKEIFLEDGTLDEDIKLQISEMMDGGLI
jgi:hypothetical protein